MLPVIVAIPYVIFQGFEPFENIGDAEGYGGVSHQVVVGIPVHSVFMVLVGPQEQRKHLHPIIATCSFLSVPSYTYMVS